MAIKNKEVVFLKYFFKNIKLLICTETELGAELFPCLCCSCGNGRGAGALPPMAAVRAQMDSALFFLIPIACYVTLLGNPRWIWESQAPTLKKKLMSGLALNE